MKEDRQDCCDRVMPMYQCHKKVWALKILKVQKDSDKAREENRESDGSAMLEFEDDRYSPIKVDSAYMRKHDPKPGGYYVVYPGGYKSWSPAEAFESGYSII